MTDERTQAPPGSPGRRRRGSSTRRTSGSNFRLQHEVAVALEQEARETGVSKVMIVEEALRRRLRDRMRAAA